jgi:NTP pyrophosphatase (non-canonical NTP hydrolase)
MGSDERNQEVSLNRISRESHQNACNKGFYDEINNLLTHPHLNEQEKLFIKRLWLNNRLMLIVTELAEASEAIRSDNYSIEPKSGGFGEELADTQIRLADLFYHANIDGEAVSLEKMKFNETRPPKHKRTL